MMATGKVALPFFQLRPRKTDPRCMVDSVPVEDLHHLVRLMALEPFGNFDDAVVIRTKLLALRHTRVDVCNNFVAQVDSYVIIIHSFISFRVFVYFRYFSFHSSFFFSFSFPPIFRFSILCFPHIYFRKIQDQLSRS